MTRRLRIAVLAPPWLAVPPTAYGGTELVLDNLSRGLRDLGHDVLLYTTGDSTCPVERQWTYERSIGIEGVSPASELRHVMDGYAAAEAWGADIVHDHTITGLVWSDRSPQLPIVTTNHGPFEGELAAVYQHLAGRIPIIAISHNQASTARGIPIAAVIHHGVDVDAVKVGRGDGGYALFLGRMSPDKGIHTAIQVARRAGIPLRIAAKMRERPELEYFNERIKPSLGGDIEYVGEVGGDAKQQLIADAQCLLNPIAWAEPFGMVMVEALAAGTPVVGTPFGASSEIVDEGVTGFLRNDVESLVAAVLKVANLERAACRAAAEARFSMRRMAEDHARLFEAVIDRDRRTLRPVTRLAVSARGIA
jgi:glycosyltransferase involved in cell wall biosynthesis